MLLAIGPQLIGIQPNEGELLSDGDVRNVAPQDLTFRFDDGQVIDPATLDGIRMTRTGLDGAFGDDADVVVEPGYVGVDPNRRNEVVVRFAETLPDDLYRIAIFGSGDTPLRNNRDEPFNDGVDESLDGAEGELVEHLAGGGGDAASGEVGDGFGGGGDRGCACRV